MKSSVHEKIIFVLKTIMFSMFIYNFIRVIVKTWKYGGSKSSVSFDDVDMVQIEPLEPSDCMDGEVPDECE